MPYGKTLILLTLQGECLQYVIYKEKMCIFWTNMVNVCDQWSMPKVYICFLLEFLCYVFYDINKCICLSMMCVLLGSWQILLKD